MSDPAPGKPVRTTRISFTRLGIVVVSVLAVLAFGFWLIKPSVLQPTPPGPTNFAGYVDVTAVPQYPFETPAGPEQQDVILAFVVADRAEGCTPSWGTYYTMEQASSDLELDRRISQLRLTGGHVRISFGGALNDELSATCTDIAALTDAYRSVIDRYEVTSIDLDIEGGALSDAAGLQRRATAIDNVQSAIQADGRDLDVWMTLPVSTAGLSDAGLAAVNGMLSAGVTLAGVNGMAMDFGGSRPASQNMADAVIQASNNLQGQVRTAFAAHGHRMDATESWSKVGITPMIGQNDVPGEVFTIADATAVNAFARDKGAGLISMWSLNRDSTCQHPLPVIITIVQTSCSGINQEGASFADVLGKQANDMTFAQGPSASPTPTPTPTATSPIIVDDPKKSPFPIWDPLGTYPAGSKVVWKQKVYQSKYWTSGFAPDTPVANAYDTPWTLLGPVLPGDKPAPLPTLPPNTYAQWNAEQSYVAGTRVQLGNVPYEAKWYTQGQKPGVAVAGGSPWVLVYPTN